MGLEDAGSTNQTQSLFWVGNNLGFLLSSSLPTGANMQFPTRYWVGNRGVEGAGSYLGQRLWCADAMDTWNPGWKVLPTQGHSVAHHQGTWCADNHARHRHVTVAVQGAICEGTCDL